MKFPAHFGLELTPADLKDLNAARSAFIADMANLTERQKLDRATAIASGNRPSDAYTRAMAQQMVDADKARADIQRLKADLDATQRDLATGGHRPKDPHSRGAALERKESLNNELAAAHILLMSIAEEKFDTAQKKAAVEFRERRQQAAKTAALNEAVAAAEARLDAEAIAKQAEGIARARRGGVGPSLQGR